MRAMMPEENLWPINEMWGIHDFSNSAQGSNAYTMAVRKYGNPNSIEEFCLQAQIVNMENHKAMFESFVSAKANGVLMWMSQSAWPSTVWQTYDYYLEQTAGYYGCKKASEPLHILWESSLNRIKIANNTGKSYENLSAEARIYNLDGTLQYTKTFATDLAEDEVKDCFTLTFPDSLSTVHFIKLELKQGETLVSDNFYWRSKTYQSYSDLRTMNQVKLKGAWQKNDSNGLQQLQVTLVNPTPDVALMIRLKTVKNQSGERVLPVYYSDNYFSLLPGETRIITLEFDGKHLNGEQIKLLVEGWNIEPMEIFEGQVGIEMIETGGENSPVSVYPNPTDELLYVSGISHFDVEIYALSGVKVLSLSNQNKHIDISSLPTGRYVLQFTDGKQKTSKVVLKK
jgi:hypothetical protein